jgi:hypothetical protein
MFGLTLKCNLVKLGKCGFRKLRPFDSRSVANQNMMAAMIAIGLLDER